MPTADKALAPVEAQDGADNGAAPVSRLLSRDAILAAQDIVTEDVAVPEWGGTVLVRGLTGRERDQFELDLLQGKGRNREVNLRNMRAKLVVRSVIDSDGDRVFSDADAVALGAKSASALQRVFRVAQRLSGLADDEVEELVGELGKDQSDDSGSD